MRASSKVLITTASAAAALFMTIGVASAQAGIPSIGSTAGMLAPIQRLFNILTDPWVMLFVVFSCIWSLFYFMYRIGFEKSGQVPTVYVHKLAMVLSMLSTAPLLWWIAQSANVKAALKTMLDYASGGAFMLAVICIFTLTYWVARRIFQPAGTP